MLPTYYIWGTYSGKSMIYEFYGLSFEDVASHVSVLSHLAWVLVL